MTALLAAAKLARSTFYYQWQMQRAGDSCASLKAQIQKDIRQAQGAVWLPSCDGPALPSRLSDQPQGRATLDAVDGPEVTGTAKEVPLLPRP